ncbi:MAG: hypothetical protein EZS28_039568 [Streblomastix strix]|uniref:Uncharacterized protein n=1 Tax=Streblomastix strix TaxID=222440 RepID=A0A5J4U2U8_9EUKA|nr:MAG: hypothetical protein EZS28_039568 [Streblomastix strix]
MIISNDSLGPSYSAIDFLNTIMLNNDSTYAQIPNSVYTLSLNPAGRLFAGGGPFLVSAKGCYIGLW